MHTEVAASQEGIASFLRCWGTLLAFCPQRLFQWLRVISRSSLLVKKGSWGGWADACWIFEGRVACFKGGTAESEFDVSFLFREDIVQVAVVAVRDVHCCKLCWEFVCNLCRIERRSSLDRASCWSKWNRWTAKIRQWICHSNHERSWLRYWKWEVLKSRPIIRKW